MKKGAHQSLSEREELILAAVNHDADYPLDKVAKNVGMSVGAVHRTFSSLIDRGIIQRFWYLNPYPLGFSLYNIYFSLIGRERGLRQRFIKYLLDSPSVVFAAEMAGRFSFCITVRCTSPQEFSKLMEALGDRFGPLFSEKAVSLVVGLVDFPTVRPGGSNQKLKTLQTGVKEGAATIDEQDEKLIQAILKDPTMTTSHIARSLGQPNSTVAYRIDRLKKAGVIAGARYFINYFNVGGAFASHYLSFSGITSKQISELSQYLAAHPSVYFIEHTVGYADMTVGMIVRNASDVSQLLQYIMDRFGTCIGRVETLLKCRFHKINGSAVSK